MRLLATFTAVIGMLLFYSEREVCGQTNWLNRTTPASPSGAPPYGSTISASQTTPQLAPQTPPPPLGASAPAPVYWGQDVFVIPYQWSAHTDQSVAKEVVLYLSKDRGANWSEIKRARPDVQSFMYRAATDGEYWFAVRTLDGSGRLWPAGGYQPELCVVVDTQIPRITQPVSTLDASGQLQIECEAVDPNLDVTSLRLAIRHAGATGWVEVPATAQPTGAPGSVHISAVWQPPAGVREVTIQAAIQDRARNPAGSAGVAPIPLQPATPQTPTYKPSAQPAAASAFGFASTATPPSTDPFLRAAPLDLPTVDAWQSTPPLQTPTPKTSPLASQPWPADTTTAAPFRASAPNSWAPASSPARIAKRAPSPFDSSPFHNASSSFGGDVTPLTPIEDSSSDARPIDPRDLLLVNHPQFALDYDLQSVGKWGVSKVEVWGTQDGGQTWRSYAEDSDNRSPVNITTPGAGRYGFRILVQGVGGLPTRPPSPGDEPEVWVEVDPQAPTAQITSVSQGAGYFGDHLIITWQADDENLESRPIALSYSGRPSGPWMPIASNLENSQRYAWRLQRHLPSSLYVRMEARDRAGNVTVDQTQQPAMLEFARPSGQIRAARPLGQ